MPDILKVTTPMIQKNSSVHPKPGADAISTLGLQDASKIIQTHNQSELLKQNTGMLTGQDAPTLLMNLLKDPAVAVTYLKNIFLLQEIFKLLPAKNTPITEEIEQYFQALLQPGQDLAGELQRQQRESTVFRGKLFDFLRQVCADNSTQIPLQKAVAHFMKAVNDLIFKDDILDAVANHLEYLKNQLASSKHLSGRLDELIEEYRSGHAKDSFASLKERTLSLLGEIEESILYSDQLRKNVSITVYNLSRYNTNEDFLQEAAFQLRQLLPLQQRKPFIELLEQFLLQYQRGEYAPDSDTKDTNVMDALVKLIQHQAQNREQTPAEQAKLETILHSLLSSPCNFTPLLHFIIPVLHQGVRAFAEVWINPQSEEQDMPKGAGKGIHFLMVIDADGIGRFETEFFVYGKVMDVSLFCPAGSESQYTGWMHSLYRMFENTSYRLGKVKVEPMKKERSLMDVFRSLPYKRVGVDVKI